MLIEDDRVACTTVKCLESTVSYDIKTGQIIPIKKTPTPPGKTDSKSSDIVSTPIPVMKPVQVPDTTPYPNPPPLFTTEEKVEGVAETFGYFIDAVMSYSLLPSDNPSPFDFQFTGPFSPGDQVVIPFLGVTLKDVLTITASGIEISEKRADTSITIISQIELQDGFGFEDWVNAYLTNKYWWQP